MADYPGDIYDPRTKENKAGVVYQSAKTTVGYAEDVVKLDDEVVALATDLIEASKVKVYRGNSTQSIPNTTMTKIQFNVELWDTYAEFDKDTNYRFTAKKAGYYNVIWQVAFASAVDQRVFQAKLYKNGAVEINTTLNASGTGFLTLGRSTDVYLDIDDYLEIWVYQNTGDTVNCVQGEDITYLTIHKLPA